METSKRKEVMLSFFHLCYGLLPYAPVLCTLVYYAGWSLLHVSYSGVLSTKLHLRFSEPACFDTMYRAAFI